MSLKNSSAEPVYSSRFLECIPRDQVALFLQDCWRILGPGGVLRVVVPDLENLSRTFPAHRDQAEHMKADSVVLGLPDHCVWRTSGGKSARYYQSLKAVPKNKKNTMAYVGKTTGEDLKTLPRRAQAELGLDPAAVTPRLRAALDPGSDQAATASLPRAQREPGQCGRVPSLALSLSQPATAVVDYRLRLDRSLHGVKQPRFEFPEPSSRPGVRWIASQGSRNAVHRGADAWLRICLTAVSLWGSRHG